MAKLQVPKGKSYLKLQSHQWAQAIQDNCRLFAVVDAQASKYVTQLFLIEDDAGLDALMCEYGHYEEADPMDHFHGEVTLRRDRDGKVEILFGKSIVAHYARFTLNITMKLYNRAAGSLLDLLAQIKEAHPHHA